MKQVLRHRGVRIATWALAVIVGWQLFQWILPTRTPAGILFRGVVLGGLSALLAVGLVLVYRSNRIISWAQGELGGCAAVLSVLLNIVVGLPYFLALAIGLAGAMAVGGLIEVTVIRRFEGAPRLLPSVATIGLASILGGVTVLLPVLLNPADEGVRPGAGAESFRTPLSDWTFTIEPLTFDGNSVLVLAVVTVAVIALGVFFTRTRYGVAIRAAAENGERAALAGVPTHRLSTLVWLIAGLLAGLATTLRAPIVGLTLGSIIGPALLLRALAAAVIGRMQSLPVTVVAAIGLAVFEQSIYWAYSRTAVVDGLLVGVILLTLLGQRGRASRAERSGALQFQGVASVRPIPAELRRLWEVVAGRWVAVAAVASAAILLPAGATEARASLYAVTAIYAIVALSLVALTGWAGQISLGQFALVAVGGAVAGKAMQGGTDFVLCLLIGVFAGMVAAVLLGIPALRLSGFFLAVTTLAFAVATASWLLRETSIAPDGEILRPMLFGRWDLESEKAYYYLCLAALALTIWMLRGLRESRVGRAIVAVRDNPEAAQAYGVNAVVAKLSAFAISGGVAGLAGALLIAQQHRLQIDQYAPAESLQAFAMTVIGGLGSIPGALIGALFVKGSQNILQGGWSLFASGVGLTFVLLVLPKGLGSLAFSARDYLLRRLAARKGIVAASLLADHDVERQPSWVFKFDDVARPRPRRDGTLLSCRDLDVSYGKVQVLFGVNLEVTEGEILALLGTNGAGKSTVLKAISGVVKPTGGDVVFDGEDVTGSPPQAMLSAGLVYMPGGRAVFPTLTVEENLQVASWSRHGDPDLTGEVDAAFTRFPALADRRYQPAGNLSGGEQQMLALSMAFLAKPRLLMIDELSLGLAPTIVELLLSIVREIHARGTTVIIVEQSVNVALTIAERAVFLEKGEVRFQGPTVELLDRPDVLRSVFLEGAASALGVTPPTHAEHVAGNGALAITDEVVLETADLRRSFGGITAVGGVDLRVRRGEVVGLIGPNGAGKTTLFDLISGFLPADGGRVTLCGEDVTDWTPDARARARLGRSFQDARLFPGLTVREVIAAAHHRHLSSVDLVSPALGLPDQRIEERLLRERVDELIELVGLQAYADKFVGELSTGSRRIVDIASAVAHDPVVLLLDEPSSGIAQRETEALGPLLKSVQAATGCSLLVIEHDMPLITSLSDRLVALELGRVIVDGTPDDVVNHPRVVASYLGSDTAAIDRSGGRARRRAPVPASKG